MELSVQNFRTFTIGSDGPDQSAGVCRLIRFSFPMALLLHIIYHTNAQASLGNSVCTKENDFPTTCLDAGSLRKYYLTVIINHNKEDVPLGWLEAHGNLTICISHMLNDAILFDAANTYLSGSKQCAGKLLKTILHGRAVKH